MLYYGGGVGTNYTLAQLNALSGPFSIGNHPLDFSPNVDNSGNSQDYTKTHDTFGIFGTRKETNSALRSDANSVSVAGTTVTIEVVLKRSESGWSTDSEKPPYKSSVVKDTGNTSNYYASGSLNGGSPYYAGTTMHMWKLL